MDSILKKRQTTEKDRMHNEHKNTNNNDNRLTKNVC